MYYTSIIDKNFNIKIPNPIVKLLSLKPGDELIWTIDTENKSITVIKGETRV